MSVAPDRPTRGPVRTVFMFVAFALGVVAVLLVVIGDSRKQVTVGALLGVWSALLGCFTLIGPRRSVSGSETGPGRPQEVHGSHEIELERRVAARREFELQLEVMLRRELEKVLRVELAGLRNEVAGLRSDLVEKVNGQLRLERIETTRVIGSDIEALQHEVRRLAGTRDVLEMAPRQALRAPISYPADSISEAAPIGPTSPNLISAAAPRAANVIVPAPAVTPISAVASNVGMPAPSAPYQAQPAPSVAYQAQPAPSAAYQAQPAPSVPYEAPAPPTLLTASPTFAAAPTPAASPSPSSAVDAARPVADLFAGLPRLGNFTVEPPAPTSSASPSIPRPPEPPPAGYVGRRRGEGGAPNDGVPDADADANDAPAGVAPPASPPASPPSSTPPAAPPQGRRRRAEGQSDDVLGRLIGR